jgi:hypothetical protein
MLAPSFFCTALFFGASLFPAQVLGTRLKHVQPTSTSRSDDVWDLEPIAPTRFGGVPEAEAVLFARQIALTNAETCGYLSGLGADPVTCASGRSCTYYTTPQSAPNFGCCVENTASSANGCGYVSTCVDYSIGKSSSLGIGAEVFLYNSGFYWQSSFAFGPIV